MKTLRYLWNVLIGIKATMLKHGARMGICPHCQHETPIYYKRGYLSAICLWCDKPIFQEFCPTCGKPFKPDESRYSYIGGGYPIYHKDCLPKKAIDRADKIEKI